MQHFRSISIFALPIALSALFAACGGGEPAAKSPTPVASSASAAPSASETTSAAPSETTAATASAAPSASAAPLAWKDMNHEQRIAFMKSTVAPKMAALYKDFDGKKYEKFDCTTCHGESAKKGVFDMPNAKLPALSVADGFKKHKDKNPKMVTFMMTKVTPAMAEMLGEPVYDPKTQKGFGCMECHTMAK
jgi:hypothetical protein